MPAALDDDQSALVEGAKTLADRIENGNLVMYSIGGYMILDHEARVKYQIGKFINVRE